MFKIGDKVRTININTKFSEDTFEVIEIIDDTIYDKKIFGMMYKIRNTTTEHQYLMAEHFLILNKVYYRKDKLKRIKDKINNEKTT